MDVLDGNGGLAVELMTKVAAEFSFTGDLQAGGGALGGFPATSGGWTR